MCHIVSYRLRVPERLGMTSGCRCSRLPLLSKTLPSFHQLAEERTPSLVKCNIPLCQTNNLNPYLLLMISAQHSAATALWLGGSASLTRQKKIHLATDVTSKRATTINTNLRFQINVPFAGRFAGSPLSGRPINTSVYTWII